jgi:hypothetical protein
MSESEKPKVKRTRKSKKEIALSNQLEQNIQLSISPPEKETTNEVTAETIQQLCSAIISNEEKTDIPDVKNEEVEIFSKEETADVVKKRGRKPKGGKIIQHTTSVQENKEVKPTVILHLKCFLKDLHQQNQNDSIDSFNFSSELSYGVINNAIPENTHIYVNNSSTTSLEDVNEKDSEMKNVWKNLKQLENNLHINNIGDKKSACFWCTHDFDNPPIYIPKYLLKNSYHVYGCFCSPECSVAYLMDEHLDSSTKFERYHLLNHIYAKIYDYKKNIKPAPNPYYMLEKYYGNLSIQEYRALLSNERLFLVVDKPLTRIMPEIHQDNEEHIINNRKVIPSSTQNSKKKIQRKVQTKNNIVSEKFGMVSSNDVINSSVH